MAMARTAPAWSPVERTSKEHGACHAVRATLAPEEVVDLVSMLLFLSQDGLEEAPGRGVVIADVADDLAVSVDRDALCNQVLLEHFDECRARNVLRVRTRGQPCRIEVRLASELHDAPREQIGVLLLLGRMHT